MPTVVLDKPYALIGSHPKAEYRLDGDGVKRRHLFVLATDEGIHVLDLVQGRQQGKPCGFWLQSAQILTVGEHRIKLCFADRELPESIPTKHHLQHPQLSSKAVSKNQKYHKIIIQYRHQILPP